MVSFNLLIPSSANGLTYRNGDSIISELLEFCNKVSLGADAEGFLLHVQKLMS